ncbi:MAG: sugar ABC transporter substrate-binding protein [Candidatus Hydrogenedentes bacterium]|nr:sugar ABC transporter substrate-binding protein [Candidatus Hydrogenedentota bacterium]
MYKFTQVLGRVALCALAVALFAGCQAKEAPSAPGSEKPRIALIMKSLANEFFKTMAQGADDFHAKNGDRFELIVNGIPNEEDVAGQVALVEQMIARGVDAIIIAPADSKALVGVLDTATKQGIVVVNIDNKLDAQVLTERGLTIPFVGPDNKAGARLAADYLATKLQSGDAVAILEGIPSAFNAQQRKLGLEEGVQAAGMKIATSQAANWEMAKANEVASGILNEHVDLKAILCANDSMALGAHAAVRESGKAGQILITGYDNIAAVAELVKSGAILCTVDQHGDQLAVYGIEFALDILAKKGAPEDRQTPVDLVTLDSLQSAPAQQ